MGHRALQHPEQRGGRSLYVNWNGMEKAAGLVLLLAGIGASALIWGFCALLRWVLGD